MEALLRRPGRVMASRFGKGKMAGDLLVVLSFALSANPAPAFPAAYCSMMFTRELVTFQATWELGARVPGR